ncbi:hypothetical protein [Archangium sp.]|uniref:hypothetical protein n=1 Tax=Archangium sp. TaxID=1872627 RepID=UPI00286D32A5|nr:hypothetical protein [Archangium sp.]
MAEEREWKQAAHQARFEAPDTVWMKLQGPVSYESLTWIVSLFRELGSQRAFIVVADMTHSTDIDPEGRRYASEHMEPEWFVAIIYIGARLIHRAAAQGIGLVYALLGKKTNPVYFVSSEAEARDIIARLRANPPA